MAGPTTPHLTRAPRPVDASRSASPPPRREALERFQVVATLNGPGEVAAWLFPFAAALKARDAGIRLGVATLPCVFASGSESDVVRSMSTVDAVCDTSASLRWLSMGETPPGFRRGLPGCVVHFGGEVMLSIALARRLRYPLVMYSEGRARLRAFIDKVCYVDSRGVPTRLRSNDRVVGNLMVDAAYMRVPVRAAAGARPRVVALFPGSRQYQVRYMLPFLAKAAGLISRERPDIRFLLARSPFVRDDELAQHAALGHDGVMEQELARWQPIGAKPALLTEQGTRIDVVSAAEAQRDADLAITIPGTNTAELGALGVPMLLVFPTYELHLNPIPGLAGHLTRIPLIGRPLKQAVASAIVRASPHFAHPNRLAGERIVPEMVGKLTAADVAGRALEMLSDSLEPMSKRLRAVMGPRGGADRLVDEVMETLLRA